MKSTLKRIAKKIRKYDTPYFNGHYDEWTDKRFRKIGELLDDNISNLNVLELSAGNANLGKFFLKLGNNVICTDGRSEHVEKMKRNFPEINSLLVDLAAPYPSFPKFNIVVHFGVLYHLPDPLKHLIDFFDKQDFEHCFLETEVSNYTDPKFVLRLREYGYDQSLTQIGGRPTSNGIEAILKSYGFDFQRIDSSDLNSAPHFYDWTEDNVEETFRVGMRRFYHIKK